MLHPGIDDDLLLSASEHHETVVRSSPTEHLSQASTKSQETERVQRSSFRTQISASRSAIVKKNSFAEAANSCRRKGRSGSSNVTIRFGVPPVTGMDQILERT